MTDKQPCQLFWRLSAAAQAALMQYQWDNYGSRLEITVPLSQGYIDTEIEPLEEIDHLMRQ